MEMTKYIVVKLKEQSYGVDVQKVLSIERLEEVTEVPRSSPFIKGVINIRGETTPIIDLKERLHVEGTEPTVDSRILIVTTEGTQIGLIVDSATEVIDIDPAVIEQAPGIIGGVHEIYLKGVAKVANKLLILLDLERILDLDESNEIQEVIADQH
ncbi:purine-binding chemotaxis protein CheW [Virgibacillus halotolerans]|nr:purine-binding chemotaxis protein CheW [Virgibacillus halotolerans]